MKFSSLLQLEAFYGIDKLKEQGQQNPIKHCLLNLTLEYQNFKMASNREISKT